jgi:hypothetical protein
MDIARSYGIGFVEISSKMKINTEEALMALSTMINVWPLIKDELGALVKQDPLVKASLLSTSSRLYYWKQEDIQKLIDESRCQKRKNSNFEY